MEKFKLEKAKELEKEIDRCQRLLDHYKKPIKDAVEEIKNLITTGKYDNLLFNFSRNEIAYLMLNSFIENIKQKLSIAEKELEEL